MSQQTINSLARAALSKSYTECNEDERIVAHIQARDLQEAVDTAFEYALDASWGPAYTTVDILIPYISDQLRHTLKDDRKFKNALARKRA